MRMAATKMSRAKTQRRKEMFLFFTVKIHPPHPDPLPPLGGEGMIFMSGGDQIPVMMVCDRNSGVRPFSRAWPAPATARRGGARAHENTP
jgi:hypothetical protein